MQGTTQKCNIDLEVRESKLYGISTNALVDGNGQFTANVVGRLRNLSGNCEHHSLMLSQGRANMADVETEVTYRLRFPRIFGHPVHAQTSIHQLWQDCQADSSYTERLRGINFDFIGCAPRFAATQQIALLAVFVSSTSTACGCIPI